MTKYEGLVVFIRNNNDVPIYELWQVACNKYGYTSTFESFRKYVSAINCRYEKNKPDVKQSRDTMIDLLKERQIISLSELQNIYDCSLFSILEMLKVYRYQGYDIYNDGCNLSLTKYKTNADSVSTPLGDRYIKFGVASDLHFGSTSCQITALNEFCEQCRKEDINHILVPGDVFAGYKTYPGQEHDVYALTSEEQEESCLLNLPTGFDWWMLGGNHDYTFVSKGGGHNPLLKLQYHFHLLFHNLQLGLGLAKSNPL